jgi:hypothetical protein
MGVFLSNDPLQTLPVTNLDVQQVVNDLGRRPFTGSVLVFAGRRKTGKEMPEIGWRRSQRL